MLSKSATTSRTDLLYFVIFVAAYFLSLQASEHLYGTLEVSSPFWLPDSILLCALLLTPRGYWWIPILAIWPIRLFSGAPAGTPAWFLVSGVLNDSLKALLAAWLLHRVLRRPVRLQTLREFMIFLGVAAAFVPLLSAIGAIPGRHALGDPMWRAGYQWFLGNALAQLIVTPTLLYWCTRAYGRVKSRLREFALLFAGLTAVLCYAFVAHHAYPEAVLLYAPVPFLIWAAVRLGPFGAANAISLVSLVAVFGAVNGTGVFSGSSSDQVLLSMQLFLVVVGLSSLSLAILIAERESKMQELEALLTERKRAEGALRESQERFRLVADSAPVLIWMSDVDKRFTFLNRGWLDFTGRSIEQELESGSPSSVHRDDVERVRQTYSDAFDARRRFEMEYRLRRHDGEDRWIVDLGVPRFDSGGGFFGYIGSCLDITDRKLAEEQLQELSGNLIDAQERERARIARELHDDFAQRMVVLQLNLTQLRRSSVGLSPEGRRELDTIVDETTRFATDIHELSHRLHPSALGILSVVNILRGLCDEVSAQHGLKIRFVHRDVPNDLARDVNACLFRIAQEALRNVVTHSGAAEAAVELSGHHGEIRLCISDAGAGFDPELPRKKPGIGLISMRERLRSVGGRLIVRSMPTQGTQIHVSVPALRASAPS